MVKRERSDEQYMPLWFQLRPAFYRALKRAADLAGIGAADVLNESVRLFEKLTVASARAGTTRNRYLRRADKLTQNTKKKVRQKRDKPLVAYRWERLSAAQRSEIARKLAEKRWSKKAK